MDTYIVTVRVMLEIEAVDQETAIELAEDAVKRTRFEVTHKMMSARNISAEARARYTDGVPQ